MKLARVLLPVIAVTAIVLSAIPAPAAEPKPPCARTNPIGALPRTASSEIEPGGFQQGRLERRWRRCQG